MGIRVHKVLGYGLNDVKYDRENWKLLDERINPKAGLLSYCHPEDYEDGEDDFTRYTSEKYLEWLENNASDGYHMDKFLKTDKVDLKGRKYDLHDCVHFQPEFGEDNVLVIRPLSMHEWSRYDDAIDYVQSAYLSKEVCANSVELIDEALYPWSGCYMDKRTGEKIASNGMYDIHIWLRAKNDGAMRPVERMDELAQALGFKDHAEALENVRPVIPEPIVDLCRYLKIFNDEKHILELRPILYTYWS